jgi:hypothetical protein
VTPERCDNSSSCSRRRDQIAEDVVSKGAEEEWMSSRRGAAGRPCAALMTMIAGRLAPPPCVLDQSVAVDVRHQVDDEDGVSSCSNSRCLSAVAGAVDVAQLFDDLVTSA